MAKASASLQIAKHVVDRKARLAIEQAVAAQQESAERLARERAAAQRQRDDDIAAILKPVAALVSADPEAVQAIARLRSKVGKGRLALSEKGRPSPRTPEVVPFLLGEPFDFRGPPYDFGMTYGNAREFANDFKIGYAGVLGDSGSFGGGAGGDVAAECGVGVAFQAVGDGLAWVQTRVSYTWEYFIEAFGAFSSAHTSGGIFIKAFGFNAKVLNERRAQAFADGVSTAGKPQHSGSGTVELPDLLMAFPVTASTWYPIVAGVWVECSHSTGLGFSRAQAKVEANVSNGHRVGGIGAITFFYYPFLP
jgi:hypothetical protein